jgi:hypothetical protein
MKWDILILLPEIADAFRVTFGALRALDETEGVIFHTISPLEDRSMRLLLKDLGKRMHEAHARDSIAAEGLADPCAGCHATSVAATGSGPQDRPSSDTTLHSVGGAKPSLSESAFSHRSLRSGSKVGDVQRSKMATALQTLPALWAHAA